MRLFVRVVVRRAGAALVAATSLLGGCSGCRRDALPQRVVPAEGESTILPRRGASEASDGGAATSSRGTKPARVATIDVAGRTRKYVLIEPASLDPAKKYPLVLVFHGDGGDAEGFHAAFPFERATGGEAVVAYPDGPYTWDLETKVANRDVAFVAGLIDDLGSRLPIDRARVFLTGYSSGGFLSNVVACQRSELVRAIASNAGGAPYKQALVWPNGYTRCPGQAPVAAIALHGGSDYGVGIDSGRFSAAYWAYVNGCNTEEMETTGYPQCRAYRGCPAGKAVAFCEIPELGHWVWDHAAEASWTFFELTAQKP